MRGSQDGRELAQWYLVPLGTICFGVEVLQQVYHLARGQPVSPLPLGVSWAVHNTRWTRHQPPRASNRGGVPARSL